MTPNSAHNAYQQIEVNSSNSLQLVVMLYDGAIRFLRQAKLCIQIRDLRGKTVAVDRSLAIVGELRSTLKLEEGGEIAQSLDKLYSYLTARILEASSKLAISPLDEAIKLLGILNSAWIELAQRDQSPDNALASANHAASTLAADSGTKGQFEVFG